MGECGIPLPAPRQDAETAHPVTEGRTTPQPHFETPLPCYRGTRKEARLQECGEEVCVLQLEGKTERETLGVTDTHTTPLTVGVPAGGKEIPGVS